MNNALASQAIVNYPHLPTSYQTVVSNTSYLYAANADTMFLSGASSNGITGVTVLLPQVPFDSQIASISASINIGSLAVNTISNNTIVQGYATASFSAYNVLKFQYHANGNFWAFRAS